MLNQRTACKRSPRCQNSHIMPTVHCYCIKLMIDGVDRSSHLDNHYSEVHRSMDDAPPAYSEQEFEQKTIDALRESQLLAPPANQNAGFEDHDGRAFEIASNRSRASTDGLAALYSLGIRNGRPGSTGIQSRPRGQTEYSNRSSLPPVEPLRIQKRGNPPSKGQNWSKPPPSWISPRDAGGSRRLDVNLEGDFRSVSPYDSNISARRDIYANDEFLPLFIADSQLDQLHDSAPNYLSLPAVTSPSHLQPSSFRPSHYLHQDPEPPLRPRSSMDDQYRSSRQSLPVTPRTPDYQVTQRPQTMSPSFPSSSISLTSPSFPPPPPPPPHRLDFNPAVAYNRPDRLELSTPSRLGALSAAAFYKYVITFFNYKHWFLQLPKLGGLFTPCFSTGSITCS